ncbi:MAG: LysR family transcriptional regulator [Thalassobaculales bacterium]
MHIRDCRLLIALAEHRHFARAAAACNISQPAFSARIQALEQALGVRLVERGSRFERFTAEGERALGWFRQIVALADGMEQALAGRDGTVSGRLRLAVIPTQLPVAGELVCLLQARHPGIEATVVSRAANAIDMAIARFEIDAGLTYVDTARSRDMRLEALYDEHLVLVAPAGLVGGGRDPVAWAEAARLPLALLTPDMQNRRIIDAAFQGVGARPRLRFEGDTFTALMGAVRLGDTATILPHDHAAMFAADPGLVLRPLVAPEVRSPVGLAAARREPELPVVAALFDTARRRFPGGR